MSQMTLDDDELFSEAASEIREDVETSLERAKKALPEAEAVWAANADNTLGVLNALRSTVDPTEATEALRNAKKWYTMGVKADAFDGDEALADDIESVESLVADLETVHEHVGELTSAIPQVKEALEATGSGSEPDTDTDADAGTAEA